MRILQNALALSHKIAHVPMTLILPYCDFIIAFGPTSYRWYTTITSNTKTSKAFHRITKTSKTKTSNSKTSNVYNIENKNIEYKNIEYNNIEHNNIEYKLVTMYSCHVLRSKCGINMQTYWRNCLEQTTIWKDGTMVYVDWLARHTPRFGKLSRPLRRTKVLLVLNSLSTQLDWNRQRRRKNIENLIFGYMLSFLSTVSVVKWNICFK